MKTHRTTVIVLGLAAAAALLGFGVLSRARPAPTPKHSARPSMSVESPRHRPQGPVPVLHAELGASPRANAAPGRTDRLGNPIVAEERCELAASGNEVCDAELAPGYDDIRPLPEEGAADDSALPVASEPAAERERPDPHRYGYRSLHDMEQAMRRRLRIPPDARVSLSVEERNGRKGVAIDVIPPEASESSRF